MSDERAMLERIRDWTQQASHVSESAAMLLADLNRKPSIPTDIMRPTKEILAEAAKSLDKFKPLQVSLKGHLPR